MQNFSLCQFLEWDSEFFQYRIARVVGDRLEPQEMPRIFSWCRTHSIDCLYMLADSNERDPIYLLELSGFQLVDIRVTLEHQLQSATIPWEHAADKNVRLSIPQDIPFLKAIAKISHHASRFYYDPHFSTAQCDALYECWIEKSCLGDADAVIVAEFNGRPAGYVSCHLGDSGNGTIGLVGVDRQARGQGLGQKMINAATAWFAAHDVRSVRVVTQGRNIQAQRVYQRCGFLTYSTQLFYHKWFDGERT